MHNNAEIVLGRRRWLAVTLGGVFGIRLYGANAEFWNRKDPSEWTSEEVAKLLANSPWAKETASGGLVVWESAQSILDARKKALADQFKNHYTLSLTRVALPKEADGDLFDHLRRFTSLTPDDQPATPPGIVERIPGSADGVLLGFSKDVVELTTTDKSIEVRTTVGSVALKAMFETKDMLYKGRLAV